MTPLQKATEDGRQKEIKAAAFNPRNKFIVYETDADLNALYEMWEGSSRDIGETILYQAFADSSCLRDYLLYNFSTRENEIVLLSDKSKRLRNED